jgi:hypothetical protein
MVSFAARDSRLSLHYLGYACFFAFNQKKTVGSSLVVVEEKLSCLKFLHLYILLLVSAVGISKYCLFLYLLVKQAA